MDKRGNVKAGTPPFGEVPAEGDVAGSLGDPAALVASDEGSWLGAAAVSALRSLTLRSHPIDPDGGCRYSRSTAMKLASISVVAASLLATALVMGCSSGPTRHTSEVDSGVIVRPDTGTTTLTDGGARDTGTITPNDTGTIIPRDTGGTTTTDSGRMCIASCTSDSQCSGTCGPAATGSVWCCGTGHCYSLHAATCPASTRDSGGGMSY